MSQRLLLVHAHPDDEVIGSGATMAHYAATGTHVTLVTCTLGDEGEILLPHLAHLAADQDDKLADHRMIELRDAMAALGVDDWRILGGPGAYRDSGMMGTPPNDRPDSFWKADILEAATHLVKIIRETKPHVMITYDDFGGYGHPDHIQAHRVAMYAASLAQAPTFKDELGPAWAIQKIYWTAFPRSVMMQGLELLKAAGEESEFTAQDPEDMNFVCPDEWVTSIIDAPEQAEKKLAAMRAHATQINTEEGFFALSNNLGSQVMGTEYFRIAQGSVAGPFDEQGRELDLFAGVTDV